MSILLCYLLVFSYWDFYYFLSPKIYIVVIWYNVVMSSKFCSVSGDHLHKDWVEFYRNPALWSSPSFTCQVAGRATQANSQWQKERQKTGSNNKPSHNNCSRFSQCALRRCLESTERTNRLISTTGCHILY